MKRRVKGSKLPVMVPADCKAIRQSLGLSQETFAEKVGVTAVTVARWEAGSTPIAKGRAIAIRGLAAAGPEEDAPGDQGHAFAR